MTSLISLEIASISDSSLKIIFRVSTNFSVIYKIFLILEYSRYELYANSYKLILFVNFEPL